MTKVEATRQWVGALLAFFAVFLSFGQANAASEIAFAMPMCIFFICAAAYSTRKKIAALQAQVDELRKSIRSDATGT